MNIRDQLRPSVAKIMTDATVPKNMKTADVKDAAKLPQANSTVEIRQISVPTPMDSMVGPSELMSKVKESAEIMQVRPMFGNGTRSKTPDQLPSGMAGQRRVNAEADKVFRLPREALGMYYNQMPMVNL